MLSEFAIIQSFFASQSRRRPDVVLGIGDDCALLNVAADHTLAVSMDILVAGRHFPHTTAAAAIGHKALAVNLSDLAAQGAEPAWVTLGLALPQADEQWLEAFCRGFFTLADRFQVQLVGGDTTRGPLTIVVQAHGLVPTGQALCRDGARPGDTIFVTGTLGDAGLGLAHRLGTMTLSPQHRSYLLGRLEQPTPRIMAGQSLRGIASASIDISDGLAQDLGHILAASQVGARVSLQRLPLSAAALAEAERKTLIRTALSAGDDYELCFTAPLEQQARISALAARWDCVCTPIGTIEKQTGLRLEQADGTLYTLEHSGYEHFNRSST